MHANQPLSIHCLVCLELAWLLAGLVCFCRIQVAGMVCVWGVENWCCVLCGWLCVCVCVCAGVGVGVCVCVAVCVCVCVLGQQFTTRSPTEASYKFRNIVGAILVQTSSG
jgi:hypothetical protein